MASKKITILDIRDRDSFLASHIKDAIHFDVHRMIEISNSLNKQDPILVYCYHGISSLRVAEVLEDLGFKIVYSLEGGYAAWS